MTRIRSISLAVVVTMALVLTALSALAPSRSRLIVEPAKLANDITI